MSDDVEVEWTVEIPREPIRKGSTTQRPEDGLDDVRSPEGYIYPPVDLSALTHLSRVNSTRRSIIEALARNTVGLGLDVRPRPQRPELPKAREADRVDEAEERTEDEAKRPAPVKPSREAIKAAKLAQRAYDAAAELDRLAQRDSVADNPTFLGLLMLVKTDEEECGNGALEISRNSVTAEIDGLYHVPGERVRRKWERDGYIVVDDRQPTNEDLFRHFLPFGAEVETDEDGRLVGWKDGATKANELLVFRLMSSESRDYGLPRDAALYVDYLADKGAAETSASFFTNSGVPPTLLFIGSETEQTGSTIKVKVPPELTRNVLNTIRASDDRLQAQVAVIPMPPGGKVDKVSLATSSDKDIGYTKYRLSVASQVLAAFRLGPVFIGMSGDTTTVDPEVQRALAQEQVFDPEQGRYQRRISSTLLPHMGFPDMELVLKKMAVEGDSSKREATERAAEVETVTNGEFREAHGLGPLVEDGVHIKQGWNRELVRAKAPTLPGQSTPTPRVNAADDQRGQRPGIGARVPRGTENQEHPRNLRVAKEAIADATEMSLVELHQRRLDAIGRELAPEG